MTLDELYQQTDKNDHKNIHVSGDRVFVRIGGAAPADEYLIVDSETGELWKIR